LRTENIIFFPAGFGEGQVSARTRLRAGAESRIIAGMSLSREEVEHIAHLARLELSEEEKERYRQQLSAILEYAARLQALDTADIPPTASVLPPRSVLRPDEPRPGLRREDLLRNAPQVEDGQFRVPPVLE